MITIKLPYESDYNVINLQKQYSSIVRFAYNRYRDKWKQKDIRHACRKLNNIDLLDSWLIQCAIMDAQALNVRFKDKDNIIFGGKKNFYKRLQGKISKEEYQLKRLSPISIQGEATKIGNRKFKLDIIENNQLIFVHKKEKYIIKLPNIRPNYKKLLYKLQDLNSVKQKEQGYTYSIRLDSKFIYISFKEFINDSIELIENRFIGIDMNPSHIGISICELNNNKLNILKTQEYDLSELTNEIINLNRASNHKLSKKLNNKLNFETIEISKSIANLAKCYKCKYVFIEDLKFDSKTKNKFYKTFNRLTRNLWKRNIFIQNLTKRNYINNIVTKLVSPQYSSFIGNMKYNYSDPINASIEICRRGYEVRILKNKKFYPEFNYNVLKDQWKKYFSIEFNSWKDFYQLVKNMKLKYRVSLDNLTDCYKVFSMNNKKSKVNIYSFY